jgi:hypothetical protein
MLFDNLMMAPDFDPSPQFQTELQAIGRNDNSNVSNILPLTTFRTIDLEGNKNSSPLFSIF